MELGNKKKWLYIGGGILIALIVLYWLYKTYMSPAPSGSGRDEEHQVGGAASDKRRQTTDATNQQLSKLYNMVGLK